MSIPLSLTVLSEPQAQDRGTNRSPSAFADFILSRERPIDRPIDLARVLKNHGLSLSKAHRVLDAIVADQAIVVALSGAPGTIMTELADFGLSARLAKP